MNIKLIFIWASACSLILSACNNQKKNEILVELTPKQELGLMLYMDPRLSIDGTISCNSCHNVMASGSDNRSFSMGVNGKRGGRNSPTVFNAKFLTVQFWDGRAKDLAEQAKGPLINPVEMGNPDHFCVVDRIKKIDGYKPYFKNIFGTEDFTIDHIADAIADYEGTLTTLNSPYDKFKAGDSKALTADQIAGHELFKSKGCVACHSGDHFAGTGTKIGEGFYQKFPTFDNNEYVSKFKLKDDNGRFDVTKKESDKHFYRVPTLRNIADTAPYFHNGSVMTLKEAVKVMAKTQLNQDLTDDETNKIEAFLISLSGQIKPQKMPSLPSTPSTTVVDPK